LIHTLHQTILNVLNVSIRVKKNDKWGNDKYYIKLPYSFDLLLQAITSPLQGFLNSIIYGWYNMQFRGTLQNSDLYGERRPLIDSANQQRNSTRSLYSESDYEERYTDDVSKNHEIWLVQPSRWEVFVVTPGN